MFQKDIKLLRNQGVSFRHTIDGMDTLGVRVLLSRRDLGLTQEELARRAKVSRSHVANIELERVTNIGVEVVEALAEVLEVSPLYLLGYTDDPLANVEESATDEQPEVADPEIQEAVNILKRWDSEQRRQFIQWMRTMSRPPG